VQLPDERLLTGSKDKTIIVWDVSENSFKCKQIISEHKGGVFSLCHLTGVRFASGSDDKSIRVWEEEKENHLFRCVNHLKEHKSRVTALALTNNGYLISGGDKVIIVYKLKDSKFIKCANFNVYGNYIRKIMKLSDGKIASSGRDNLIKIWNEKNGELFLSEILKGHTHSVYDMVELRDGRLASVSGDNLVIIWKSGKVID
jgi:WD40 repeat protein